MTVRINHLVALTLARNQGGVKGATTKVINQYAGALGVNGGGVTLGVFKTGGAGLINHGQHLPAATLKSINGHQALTAKSVGRNANYRL